MKGSTASPISNLRSFMTCQIDVLRFPVPEKQNRSCSRADHEKSLPTYFERLKDANSARGDSKKVSFDRAILFELFMLRLQLWSCNK